MSAMANIYLALIKKGAKTIDDVPQKLKEEVQGLIDAESEKASDQEAGD